ncbi:MAG TPA: anti-sigma factor [Marmoricola sp.]|jgi:anti-sigma-K factor RskA|nr:anti-sigma factor [Marmoricola sp.]
MSAHEIHALSGAYAVDALDDLERARFEQHLSACAECRAEVASLQDAAAMFPALTETAPPAALRDAVLAEIKTVRPLPPTVARLDARRPRRFANIIAAAAVLGVLGGGVAVYENANGGNGSNHGAISAADQILQASDVQHISSPVRSGGTATVFRSEQVHGAVLVAKNISPAPKGRIYQLWLRNKAGIMVPAGKLSGGDHTVVLNGDSDDASGAGITVEPDGGSKHPTTVPVALMDFGPAT